MALPGLPGMMPPMGPQGPPMDMPPQAATGLEALKGLGGQGQSPQADQWVKALKMAHQIIMTILPGIVQADSQAAQNLHQVGKTIMGIITDLQREQPIQPPPDLMMGMGPGGPMGAPPGLP